jgi:hypothetical protein
LEAGAYGGVGIALGVGDGGGGGEEGVAGGYFSCKFNGTLGQGCFFSFPLFFRSFFGFCLVNEPLHFFVHFHFVFRLRYRHFNGDFILLFLIFLALFFYSQCFEEESNLICAFSAVSFAGF